MKAIMLMFDTLNRHMLPPYGCDWTVAPNFRRLAEKTAVFNNAYIGSMPCMPARRELHTGRYNFLHRIWGPLEPFDDSMPEILKKNSIYTHLITDHMHYFEDGGCTYHTRYNSWEFIRGLQGDPWKGQVADPEIPKHIGHRDTMPSWRQDWINRKNFKNDSDYPIAQVFENAFDFLRTNGKDDGWFLQIENFNPHEPFFSPEKYKQFYKDTYKGRHFNWPDYAEVAESPEEIEHCRFEYAAMLTMCDDYLGRLLDIMDELDLWNETMLIVNSDHGILLGEHGRWGKRVCSNYNEIARIPLFIWDPRSKIQNVTRESLVQTIDLAPTLLDYFGISVPEDMQGKVLKDTIERDQPIREALLFGLFGAQINCTDGRYVYMRAPQVPYGEYLFNYTLMPTYLGERFSPEELADCQLSPPHSFTKGCPLLKVKPRKLPTKPFLSYEKFKTMLFDLKHDPEQKNPVDDPEVEKMMIEHMIKLMKDTDAPAEQ